MSILGYKSLFNNNFYDNNNNPVFFPDPDPEELKHGSGSVKLFFVIRNPNP